MARAQRARDQIHGLRKLLLELPHALLCLVADPAERKSGGKQGDAHGDPEHAKRHLHRTTKPNSIAKMEASTTRPIVTCMPECSTA